MFPPSSQDLSKPSKHHSIHIRESCQDWYASLVEENAITKKQQLFPPLWNLRLKLVRTLTCVQWIRRQVAYQLSSYRESKQASKCLITIWTNSWTERGLASSALIHANCCQVHIHEVRRQVRASVSTNVGPSGNHLVVKKMGRRQGQQISSIKQASVWSQSDQTVGLKEVWLLLPSSMQIDAKCTSMWWETS